MVTHMRRRTNTWSTNGATPVVDGSTAIELTLPISTYRASAAMRDQAAALMTDNNANIVSPMISDDLQEDGDVVSPVSTTRSYFCAGL